MLILLTSTTPEKSEAVKPKIFRTIAMPLLKDNVTRLSVLVRLHKINYSSSQPHNLALRTHSTLRYELIQRRLFGGHEIYSSFV